MEKDVNTPVDIQLQLMSISHFYGDFSIIYHLTNRNSSLYTAVLNGDINALRKFLIRNDINIELLSENEKQEYKITQTNIVDEYKAELEQNPLPLPERYLISLAERAIQLGHYSAANSALDVIDKLDKKVNEFIVKGTQLLQSKEVQSDFSAGDVQANEIFQHKIKEAAENFYRAIRIKNAIGNQFQYLSSNLHLKDHDALRKYFKYVENSLLKEIIEYAITYLTDDKIIAPKIIQSLTTGKVRKTYLKYFAAAFSAAGDHLDHFNERYKKAVMIFRDAKEERDFLSIQKILLGRNTGDNEYYEFLRELAVEHPISSLLISIAITPDGTPFLAPIVMKSGTSLMEFIELDK